MITFQWNFNPLKCCWQYNLMIPLGENWRESPHRTSRHNPDEFLCVPPADTHSTVHETPWTSTQTPPNVANSSPNESRKIRIITVRLNNDIYYLQWRVDEETGELFFWRFVRRIAVYLYLVLFVDGEGLLECLLKLMTSWVGSAEPYLKPVRYLGQCFIS
jgi:hypothetical protein